MLDSIEAIKREKFGKSAVRKLRKEGYVPGVFYIHGEEAIPIAFDFKEISHFLQEAHGLIELKLKNSKDSFKCIVKDVQFDPVTDNVIHVDFQGVKMGQKITMTVPLVLKGTPAGVKEGGILEYLIRELEISCLPRYIPEYLEWDISDMKIGDVLHAGDLKFENIEILDDPNETVVILEAPKVAEVVVEEEALLEEEEQEPEVITSKREEKTEESEEES